MCKRAKVIMCEKSKCEVTIMGIVRNGYKSVKMNKKTFLKCAIFNFQHKDHLNNRRKYGTQIFTVPM